VVAWIDVFFDERPMGHAVGQYDAADRQRHPGHHELGRGIQSQGVTRDALKQQNGKQKEVDQRIHLPPNGSIQLGVSTNQIPANNEREIWQDELEIVHSP